MVRNCAAFGFCFFTASTLPCPATHQRAGGRSATGEVLRVVPGRAGWDALRSAGTLNVGSTWIYWGEPDI